MLKMPRPKLRHTMRRNLLLVTGLACLIGGAYVLSLVLAPSVALNFNDPISIASLPKPHLGNDRIIIPTIGVNIHYGTDGVRSLDEGAWWRYPDRGSPEKGGNFIIAAHRFSIQPTPQQTVIKSPFYHIDAVHSGDKILIDYNGTRYAYQVYETKQVAPSAIEIEAPTTTPRLTVYSCTLDGSSDGRVVLFAKPLGQVNVS